MYRHLMPLVLHFSKICKTLCFRILIRSCVFQFPRKATWKILLDLFFLWVLQKGVENLVTSSCRCSQLLTSPSAVSWMTNLVPFCSISPIRVFSLVDGVQKLLLWYRNTFSLQRLLFYCQNYNGSANVSPILQYPFRTSPWHLEAARMCKLRMIVKLHIFRVLGSRMVWQPPGGWETA